MVEIAPGTCPGSLHRVLHRIGQKRRSILLGVRVPPRKIASTSKENRASEGSDGDVRKIPPLHSSTF